MPVSTSHEPSLRRGVDTTPANRPDFGASQPAVIPLAHSDTNPAFWRMVFSRSVSESSSQTIRIRTPSGTFNVKPERVLLSPVVSRVRVRRLIPRTLHFCVPVLGLTQICHHCFPRQFPSLGSLFGSSGSRSSRPLDMSLLGGDSHIPHSQ